MVVAMQQQYGLPADIFSFGVILCQMITRKYPYEGMESIFKQGARTNESLNTTFRGAIINGFRPVIPRKSLIKSFPKFLTC
jgi:hypothetical protein